MLIKFECTIGNKEMNDIECIKHFTRPIGLKMEVIKQLRKQYGKQLICVDCLSVNDKVNSDFINSSKYYSSMFGTYWFNSLND